MHHQVTNLVIDFNSIKIIISLGSMLTKCLINHFIYFGKMQIFRVLQFYPP